MIFVIHPNQAFFRRLPAIASLMLLLGGCAMVAARKDRAQTLRDPDGQFRLDTKWLPFGTEAFCSHTPQGSLYRVREADGDISEMHTELNAHDGTNLRPLLEQFVLRRLRVEEFDAAEPVEAVPGGKNITVLRGHGVSVETGDERRFSVMGCIARGRLFIFYREEKRYGAGKHGLKQPAEIRAHLEAFARRFRWTNR